MTHKILSIILLGFIPSILFAQAPDTAWTKTYGGTDDDMLFSIRQTADGGFIMAGGKGATSQSGDFWLVKTDAQGDTLWTRTYGGDSWENCYTMQQTSDGGFILMGLTESFGGRIYSLSGQILTETHYGQESLEEMWILVKDRFYRPPIVDLLS